MNKIFIGKDGQFGGQKDYYTAFNIDNNAFPNLVNAYTFRGRVKRKRGTTQLGRLQRQIKLVSSVTLNWQFPQLTLVAGVANLVGTTISAITIGATTTFTINGSMFSVGDFVTISGIPGGGYVALNGVSAQVSSISATTMVLNYNSVGFAGATSVGLAILTNFLGIVPGSISITVGANAYTEPSTPDGTLVGAPSGSGTINYATGAFTIAAGGSGTVIGTFAYYPGLPVMGCRDFNTSDVTEFFPVPLEFDTDFSYMLNSSKNNFYNVNFYKQTQTPFYWNGQNYQQFFTVNYENALWATNGNPGFNFLQGTYTSGTGSTTITLNLKYQGNNYISLIIGDVLFFNEWGSNNVNLNTGTVSTVSGGGNYIVTFINNVTISGTGIVQMLTQSLPGQDGIKWFDGDPTGKTGIPNAPSPSAGWVNFSPPLQSATSNIFPLGAGQWYLVGAVIVLNFKDRLLFFGPTIGNSSGTPIYMPDTVLWSRNGTPYYTASSDNAAIPTYTPVLVPIDEGANPNNWFVNETGLGGFLPAGISQPITTVSTNEDVLIIGFGGNGRKTRFVSTGNDIQPFLFFTINSELPSSSTFSAITLDRGVLDIGTYGIAMTDQQSSQRIDLDIPDYVFEIQNNNNGNNRVNAIRDFTLELIYFTYPPNWSQWEFPTQSLLYNYRENSWSVIYENYTAQGRYRQNSGQTWATIGEVYPTWAQWNQPWNAGGQSALIANVIGGTPQGFVMVKDEGTEEDYSCAITAITSNGGLVQITSPNHCVTDSNQLTQSADYLYFNNALGSTFINGKIGKVTQIIDVNNFVVDIAYMSSTYLGLGTFAKLSQPLIQTKQLNPFWDQGRKVRLGVQRYLFDTTQSAQVTVNIYLSQDATNAWNDPNTSGSPNSLIYGQIVYTCPESTNLGLTPFNVNLQMPTAVSQSQIWHRMNTSLLGDSVQLGITLSDAQMRNYYYATAEIVLHGIVLDVAPSQLLV